MLWSIASKIILQSVTAEECANYFIAAGYVKA
jgi:hypothetical protein